MYFDIDKGIEVNNQTQCLKGEEFDVYWEGFIFIKGELPGRQSVNLFLEKMKESDFYEAVSILSGNFSCLIHFKEKNIWYGFTDGSRLGALFYTKDAICSSFLEIASKKKLDYKSLNPYCVVEFILTGLQFTKKFLFEQINIIDASEVLVIHPKLSITLEKLKKDRSPFDREIQPDPEKSFFDIMKQIVASIRPFKVSVDITGGTDSRFTVGVLNYLGLKFETAVCGNPKYSDVIIASKVAKLINNDSNFFHPVPHHVTPSSLWEELDSVVRATDGVCGAVGYQRLYQLAMDRKKRGIDLTIGSSGGELYKDGGWWRTAFASRSNKDLLRRLASSGLVSWGIVGEIPCHIFQGHLREISKNYKESVHKDLTNNFLSKNENKYELADRIFYEYSVRAPRGFGCRIANSYAPHLDPELVAIGVRLSFLNRFRHQFYRKILSKINPGIAKLSTNRGGMSEIAGVRGLVRDVLGMARWKLSKDKGVPKENPQLYSSLRELTETKEALASLKDFNIIAKDITLKDINNAYLGRLITLFKVLKIVAEQKV